MQVSREARAFLEREHRLYIGNEWVSARDGEALEIVDPATASQIARVQGGGPGDVDEAVRAARAALGSGAWPRMSPADRGALLWKLAERLEAHEAVLTALEVLDTGMPVSTGGRMAVPGAARMLRYYAGWPSRIFGQTVPPDGRPGASSPPFTFTLREPVGVVAQIIPWNYPLGMMAMKLGPALAAGCTVVMKTDEKTPMSGLYLAELVREVGFPPGVINILPGLGHRAGAAMTAHPDIDKVAFTGSLEVAKQIIAAAAGNLKRVTLELGGKAPFIIFPDADIGEAIATAARSAFFLQGQNCQATTRVLAHESVADEVLAGIVAAASAMKIGPGLDEETRLGPLISAAHLDRVQAHVASGLEEGGRLVWGGDRLEGPGYFMRPAVFTEVRPAMRIVREEIFGPVLCVERFGDDAPERLAARVNDSPHGLVASVWTRDLHRAHRMVELIRAGVVSVNQHAGVNIFAPFGGYRQSGWGREFGAESLDHYLETKQVVLRHTASGT